MATDHNITGAAAIDFAERAGFPTVHCYANAVDDGGPVDLDTAREIAAVDPSLITLDLGVDTPARFTPGAHYCARSVANFDCVWIFEIVRRTERTVWLREHGVGDAPVLRRRIRISDCTLGATEAVDPLGSYSMSPTLFASSPGGA